MSQNPQSIMPPEQLKAAWTHLWSWWKEEGALYNVPEIARRAGVGKGRAYAALVPGSQGGTTVRYTLQLYLDITDVLGKGYRRPYSAFEKPSDEELAAHYQTEGAAQLAQRYHTSKPTVLKWLERAGIGKRPRGTRGHRPAVFTLEEAREAVASGALMADWAKTLGVSTVSVSKRFQELDSSWMEEARQWRIARWADIMEFMRQQPAATITVRGLFASQTQYLAALQGRAYPDRPLLLVLLQALHEKHLFPLNA